MNEVAEEIPWMDIVPNVVKAPYYAYKNRHLVQKLWTHLVHVCGKGETDIVVTGRTASGKSVLSARMRGITEDLAWELPSKSRDTESDVIGIAEWARIVRVIPGHTSQERDNGLHEAFNSNKNLEGVIHVVDWGFACERDSVIIEKRIKEQGIDTIEKWRAFNLDLELKEFIQLCTRIRETHSRCGRPKWLLVAVNKCDLFMNQLNLAEEYYHPESNSPFSDAFRDLQSHIGKNNIHCSALPVSSWDKDFQWNGETIKSQVGGTTESRALFRNFVQTVSSLSASSDKRK